jgi:hypothetical protein
MLDNRQNLSYQDDSGMSLQLEDTAVLTKFLQIDMDGIKRERSTQL